MELWAMLKAIRGRYKNGKVELYEKPQLEEGKIIGTFLNSKEPGSADLRARGITQSDAE